MNILFLIYSGLVGAIFGSFAVAQVWRIRAGQLLAEKEQGEKINSAEWKKLKNLTKKGREKQRSHCLSCGYELKWFDLIPIFSWLSLRGKCRKCRKIIGWQEFFAEISMAVIFAIFASRSQIFSGEFSFLEILKIVIFVAISVVLLILFVYDAKWSLLPTKFLWAFSALAAIYFAIMNFQSGLSVEIFANLTISILIFPFLYLALTIISKGAWVGDGDWILALGLVLLLPNAPVFSIFLLLFSNLIGILMIILAGIFHKKKIQRGAQIPFGPAMILACLILVIFQPFFEEIVKFLS